MATAPGRTEPGLDAVLASEGGTDRPPVAALARQGHPPALVWDVGVSLLRLGLVAGAVAAVGERPR